MPYLLQMGLFLPLAGFLILMTASNKKIIHWIACSTIFLSFLCFSALAFHLPLTTSLFQWIPVPGINADFSLHLDELSSLMTLIITGVGFLIHVYSIGYMDHDSDQGRFFACLNFFVFAMLLLVLASNLLLLFVGWEGVGLASYLLIGFWYERSSAASAATKAFVVNRIGDFGFLVGLLLTFKLFGTSDIASILEQSEGLTVGLPIITLLTLLYFMGATGKSAQIPLHVWLPDAMEGPTPVSALIHAATMVTAGVYLIVRLHPLFLLAPDTLMVIAVIGTATALFAAIAALSQTDLKRVLAYSTISQLGYMFLACGIGAFYAAMFHLTMHAFIKALLFLSAGNAIHMLHDTTEMAKMGGLSKVLKKTNWLFLIGVLALSGIPPLAAFFSKDMILEEAYAGGFKILFYIALFTAALTGFYLTRAYFLAFRGQLSEENTQVKEAPSIMLIPVAILAVLSIIGGFFGHHITFSFTLWLSVAGSLLGVLSAAVIYSKYSEHLGKPWQVLKKAFYLDEIYEALFVKPLRMVANFIDDFMEPKIFENSIDFAGNSAERIAGSLQKIQNGQIRSYVAWMAIGAIFLIAYLTL